VVAGGGSADPGLVSNLNYVIHPIIVYTKNDGTVTWAKQLSATDNYVNAIKFSYLGEYVVAVLN
jgi:hypothetical protein